jgi:hypothetical protein
MSCSSLTTCESCAAARFCDWCFGSKSCVFSSFLQCSSLYADDPPDCAADPQLQTRTITNQEQSSSASNVMSISITTNINANSNVASATTFSFFTASSPADQLSTLSSLDVALLSVGVVFASVLLIVCIFFAVRHQRRRSKTTSVSNLSNTTTPITPTMNASSLSSSDVEMPNSVTIAPIQQTTYAAAPALGGTISISNPSFATQNYSSAPNLND